MTVVGANADELERLAAEFRRAADDLDRDGGLMTQLLNNISWIGDVAGKFLNGWSGVQLPKIGLSTRFLREAADDLERNAREQRGASEGGTGVVGTVGGTESSSGGPPRSDRLDTAEARAEVLGKAETWLRDGTTAQSVFPQTHRRLQAWLAELQTGDPSAQEVAAFDSYLAMLKLANIQRSVVADAATHAFEQFIESAKAGASSVEGLVGLPGELDGGLSATNELAERMFDQVISAAGGEVDGAIRDGLYAATGLTQAGPAAMVARYMADADAALIEMEAAFRSQDGIGHVSPTKLVTTQYDVFNGHGAMAAQKADYAEAFTPLTGDGSALDTALRGGLKVLTGGVAAKALDGLAVVGGGAQASYHFQSGVESLSVASSGVDSLYAAFDMVTFGEGELP